MAHTLTATEPAAKPAVSPSAKQQAESETKNRKEIEQRYMALKIIDQQIKQAQKQFMLLDQQANELDTTKEALNELSKIKAGAEILVPIANGVFAKATLTDGYSYIVNVGANTSVTKPVDAVKKIIDEQSVEIRKAEEEIGEQLQQLAMQAQAIEQDMQHIL